MGFGYVLLTEREIEFLRTSAVALRVLAEWHQERSSAAEELGRVAAYQAHASRAHLLWVEAARLEARS